MRLSGAGSCFRPPGVAATGCPPERRHSRQPGAVGRPRPRTAAGPSSRSSSVRSGSCRQGRCVAAESGDPRSASHSSCMALAATLCARTHPSGREWPEGPRAGGATRPTWSHGGIATHRRAPEVANQWKREHPHGPQRSTVIWAASGVAAMIDTAPIRSPMAEDPRAGRHTPGGSRSCRSTWPR